MALHRRSEDARKKYIYLIDTMGGKEIIVRYAAFPVSALGVRQRSMCRASIDARESDCLNLQWA